jgi:hypothetical protein
VIVTDVAKRYASQSKSLIVSDVRNSSSHVVMCVVLQERLARWFLVLVEHAQRWCVSQIQDQCFVVKKIPVLWSSAQESARRLLEQKRDAPKLFVLKAEEGEEGAAVMEKADGEGAKDMTKVEEAAEDPIFNVSFNGGPRQIQWRSVRKMAAPLEVAASTILDPVNIARVPLVLSTTVG